MGRKIIQDKTLEDLIPLIKNQKLLDFISENPKTVYRPLWMEQHDTSKCIYGIYTLHNGIFYVGQAKNFRNRMRVHRRSFIANHHHSTWMKNVWNKHGNENFICFILEYTENLKERELYWINKLDSFKNGYNATLNTDENFYDPELIRKNIERQSIAVVCLDLEGKFIQEFSSISDAARHVKDESTNISKCCKGKSRSVKNCIFIYKSEYDETKDYKLKPITYDHLRTPEWREFVSSNHKGRKHTKEHRVKLSISQGTAVKCITDNKEFDSIRQAAIYYNIAPCSIKRAIEADRYMTRIKLQFKYINKNNKDDSVTN